MTVQALTPKWLLVTFILIMIGSRSSWGQVTLVRNGEAVAVIVAKPSPIAHKDHRGRKQTDPNRYAAQVLSDWIGKITGVNPPIVEEVPPASQPAIIVGDSSGLNLDNIDSSTREGLRVKTVKNRVLVAGQNWNSTVKAACRLLESLGCRYFMDHPLGEVYPATKTLTVPQLDITEKPRLVYRRIWGSTWTQESLWKIWNGHGGDRLSTAHAWSSYVDRKAHADNPEWFALRAGERKAGGWYCTTNEQLQAKFTESLLTKISRGESHPSISPPDGNGYCECDKCKALDDPHNIEPSSATTSMSNRYAIFFDKVARAAYDKHPQSLVNFYCYAGYTQAPTNDVRFPPNLVAWIAPIRYSRYHQIGSPYSPSRYQLASMIDGWRRVSHKIAYRTYNYNLAECFVPFSKLSIWAHDVPYLVSHGCIGFNLETLPSWHIYGPHIYQSIRLAYDPSLDSHALMNDYFQHMYGPAASMIQAYWNDIDQAFAHMPCETGSFHALHLVYTPDRLKRLQAFIESAKQAVQGNDAYAERVTLTEHGLRNAQAYMAIREAINSGKIAIASQLFNDTLSRNEALVARKLSNHYTPRYFKRFLGNMLTPLATMVKAPNQLVTQLPDRWQFQYDPDSTGMEKGFTKPEFDNRHWLSVATFSNSLTGQGLEDRKMPLWYRTRFTVDRKLRHPSIVMFETDGNTSVYLNGVPLVEDSKSRRLIECPAGDALKVGENTIAVRVDHTRITELSLGGIIRPVFIVDRVEPLADK